MAEFPFLHPGGGMDDADVGYYTVLPGSAQDPKIYSAPSTNSWVTFCAAFADQTALPGYVNCVDDDGNIVRLPVLDSPDGR